MLFGRINRKILLLRAMVINETSFVLRLLMIVVSMLQSLSFGFCFLTSLGYEF